MSNFHSHDVGFCVGALVDDNLNEMKLKHLFSRTFSWAKSPCQLIEFDCGQIWDGWCEYQVLKSENRLNMMRG